MTREEARVESIPKLMLFVVRAMLARRGLLAACVAASFGVAAATTLFATLPLVLIEMLGGKTVPVAKFSLFSLVLPLFRSMPPESQVRMFAGAILAVTVARALFGYVEGRLSQYLSLVIERDLRQRVFDEIVEADQSYLTGERAANLHTLLHTYPRQTAAIADQLLAGLTRTLSFLGIVATLLALSWQLTLIAGGLSLVAFLVLTRLRAMIRQMGREVNTERVKLNEVSLEALHSMKLVRAFGRERETRDGFVGAVRRLQRASYRRASVVALTPQLQRIIGMAFFALVLVLATIILPPVNAGWLAVVMAFVFVVGQLQSPLNSVSRKQMKILTELPAVEELMSFFAQPKPKMKDGTRPFTGLKEGVRFENVSFAYASGGAAVLHDVSFALPRGRTVALVGGSGSGKSTLVQLLARLADPTQGRIVVDGHDLRELQKETWRRRLAIVTQETFLFNTSVRENIRFGRPDASDGEVEEAARLAEAHEFIESLEQGYDTVVGDRGARLSGGQAQRIAIARALLADPDILVLDEATSALDAATERAVQLAIERVSHGRTVLAVAHRLATVRAADEIIVLESGRITERGTHRELMARGGGYARYVEMQDLGRDAAVEVRQVAPAPPPPAPALVARLVIGPEGARVVESTGASRVVRLAPRNGVRPDGDVAELTEGSPVARVTLAGRAHDDVPIYEKRPDGSEVHSRVKTIRAPARTPLERLARRFLR